MGTETGGGKAVMKARSCCGALLLSVTALFFARRSRHESDALFPLTLSILSLLLWLRCCYLLCCGPIRSAYFPPAMEGRDLNPMLQHLGLIYIRRCSICYGGLDDAASVQRWLRYCAAVLTRQPPGVLALGVTRWCALDAGDHSRIVVGVLRTGLGRLVFGDPVKMPRCCRGCRQRLAVL